MRNSDEEYSSIEKIGLDQLVVGRLPERTLEAISQLKLTVEELVEWQAGKPSVHLLVTDGKLMIEINAAIPIDKKTLAILGSLSVIAISLVNFATQHPNLYTLLHELFLKVLQSGA